MEGFIDTLRHRFKMATLSARIIYVNIAVFVVLRLIGILGFLFGFDANSIISYVELPSSPTWFIYQPWTIITYMFAHYDVLHILFNMLWLWWFGQLFLQFLSPRQLTGLYFVGGIGGGLLYMLAYNLLPAFAGPGLRHCEHPPAQRPRYRYRRHGAWPDGRRGPRGRHAVWQRGAHG